MPNQRDSTRYILQNLAQLKALFEKQWESIVGNCDEFLYLGGNEQSIKGLHTIGIEAVILTLGSTLGSVIAAWALWKALYRKKGKTA